MYILFDESKDLVHFISVNVKCSLNVRNFKSDRCKILCETSYNVLKASGSKLRVLLGKKHFI